MERETIDKFCQLIEKDIVNRVGESPDLTTVLSFLIEHGYIETKSIRDKMIIYEYPIVLSENNFHFMHSVYELANKYDISERSVQYIISDAAKR